MGMVEEILKNKEDLFIKLLEILQGKEASASIDLSGVQFHVGTSSVKLDGEIKITLIPKGGKK
ncbi:MAG: hypothetical protein ACXABY_14670 [Candidatus Thorarchaeota archaeon]|jgi:hypothetical protein